MDRLTKLPNEVRTYEFDFTNKAEIVNGDTLSSVVSVSCSPSGLTLGAHVVSGNSVQANISGGTSGSAYLVTCYASTTGGSTLGLEGTLYVEY